MNNLQHARSPEEQQGGEQRFVSNKLPDSFAALAAELWVASSARGGRLSSALGSVLGWRLEEAEEILDSELRQIKRRLSRVGEVEEAAGMVFRYIRTAQEGVHRKSILGLWPRSSGDWHRRPGRRRLISFVSLMLLRR